MSLFKPFNLKQLSVLALSLGVAVYAPLEAQAEKGVGVSRPIFATLDPDVVTEETVKFEDYFTGWSNKHDLSDRMSISLVRTGTTVLLASATRRLSAELKAYAQKNAGALPKSALSPLTNIANGKRTFLAKLDLQIPAANGASKFLKFATFVLLADAATGVLIAYNGHKPLYVGNLFALAKYMHDVEKAPLHKNRPMTSIERNEQEEFERALSQELAKGFL